ncbi:MAG: glycosyltransferase family A protein, partial [Bacteroidales bacterium]
MATKINCFIPVTEKAQVIETLNGLKESGLVFKIYLLATEKLNEKIDGCEILNVDSLNSSATIKKIAEKSDVDYSLIYTKYTTLKLGYFALERMVKIAEDSKAFMLYADHYQIADDNKTASPVIDYQFGSLRDDFNFGSVLVYKAEALKCGASRMKQDYKFAGQYDLRLKVSQKGNLVHINEYLYSEIENDTRKSGEKIFDYVDPKNRGVQMEMEQACTEHLKEIEGYLEPVFKRIEFNENNFEFEASVIIPVFNRIRTIRDAVKSVLNQETKFKFNLIIIDNHSTDGTSQAIKEFAADSRLIHLIPARKDLGIGGCWNAGVHHPKCGKFAVQLDSDD